MNETQKTVKCAIYARVSTKEKAICPGCEKKVRVSEGRLIEHQDREYRACAGSGHEAAEEEKAGQDTENQLVQLREYCARKNWTITEYVDRETAKHGQRDMFKRMFDDASRRLFDVVLVWALDRFTREGVHETFDYIDKLTKNGVQFESYTEEHFRTTGPAGELMLAVAAWIAKQERQRISDRTRAGLAKFRDPKTGKCTLETAGKKCGRPRRVFSRGEAAELRKQGMSWRRIAKTLGVPFSTVRRAV
jgi:DNA invertase Pin-like site-specific DNA recombinase